MFLKKLEQMEVEGEINNFIMVWTVAAASLCYCHIIGKLIREGTIRILALLPVIVLFLLLPLRLTSIHLGGPSSFFLGWLSTFKLFLFAFGKGPLSSSPPLSLSHFVPVACLPIKFQPPNQLKPLKPQTHDHPSPQITKSGHKSPLNYTIKALLLVTFIPAYEKKEHTHPKLLLFLYSIHMYVSLEIILAVVAALTRTFLGVELEPQFDEPYLSTSLQDFWGRRWNVMVNRILHPTVYDPIVSASSRVIGRKWAPIPAIVVTFMVSGLMHELIFYYIKREKPTWEPWEPTWEVTCFFLLHGVCLSAEVAIKKALRGRWQLPRAVSGPLAVAFVVTTGLWLFLPSLVRCRVDVKARRECNALIEFVKNVQGILRFA